MITMHGIVVAAGKPVRAHAHPEQSEHLPSVALLLAVGLVLFVLLFFPLCLLHVLRTDTRCLGRRVVFFRLWRLGVFQFLLSV